MQKKIILAVDSFKGSASSLEIESYIETGIKEILPDVECVKIPIADGGEGTVEAIVTARKGTYKEVQVQDPLGRSITAHYGLLPDGTAVLEMSKASGITLVSKEERNPLKASTYGTGQLLLDALNHGATDIYIGIGGSATNDGGLGMVMALGAKFYDAENNELPAEAASLNKIVRVDITDLDKRLAQVNITILSDVENPLCGPYGASHVYGGQKGADEAMKVQLDNYLAHYAKIMKEQLGKDVANVPGAGAAGGLGAGLLIFTPAKMQKGIDAVLDVIHMSDYIEGAGLVITGEGRMDHQTAFGKAPVGIAMLAKERNIPVIAVVGSVALDADPVYETGISLIIDVINEPMGLEEAIANVETYAIHAGKTVGRIAKKWIL